MDVKFCCICVQSQRNFCFIQQQLMHDSKNYCMIIFTLWSISEQKPVLFHRVHKKLMYARFFWFLFVLWLIPESFFLRLCVCLYRNKKYIIWVFFVALAMPAAPLQQFKIILFSLCVHFNRKKSENWNLFFILIIISRNNDFNRL